MKKNKTAKIGWKGDLKRLWNISTILYEEGFDIFISRLKLRHCISLKCRIQCFFHRRKCNFKLMRRDPVEVRFRRTLEKLGPTFIKLGQVLSLRNDFLPQSFCDELKKLQSNVPPFSSDMALKIVEEESGKPVSKLFSEFEREPLAAASIAQVHGAILKNGTHVVVKIQRPNVDAKVLADLEILLWFARQAEQRVPKLRRYRPFEMAKEFARYTRKELDFTEEANIATRFRENFSDNSDIYIPRIYKDLSTSKVMVMERIYGRSLEPVTTLADDGYNPKRLSQKIIRSVIEQVFLFGLFHADPHPGNMIVMKNGSICFIDFGMYGEISKILQKQMFRIFLLMSKGDLKEAVDGIIEMAEIDEFTDIPGFQDALFEVYQTWYSSSISETSLAMLFFKEVQLAGEFGLRLPGGIILLARALLTIESVGRQLFPNMNLAEEALPILEKLLLKKIDLVKLWGDYTSLVPDLLGLAEVGPDLVQQAISVLYKFKSANLSVLFAAQANHQKLIGTNTKKSNLSWIFISGLFIGGSILAHANLPVADFKYLSFLGLSWMVAASLALAISGSIWLLFKRKQE